MEQPSEAATAASADKPKLVVASAEDDVSPEEIAALEAELARVLGERSSETALTAKEVAALDTHLAATRKREANATNDCAARVADITTTLVSKELSNLDDRYVPVDGTAALADTYSTLQTEQTTLLEEEAQRNVRAGNDRGCRLQLQPDQYGYRPSSPRCCAPVTFPALQARIGAMEKALLASQDRVAAATRKFDAILSDIRDVKETLSRREVSTAEADCRCSSPCSYLILSWFLLAVAEHAFAIWCAVPSLPPTACAV